MTVTHFSQNIIPNHTKNNTTSKEECKTGKATYWLQIALLHQASRGTWPEGQTSPIGPEPLSKDLIATFRKLARPFFMFCITSMIVFLLHFFCVCSMFVLVSHRSIWPRDAFFWGELEPRSLLITTLSQSTAAALSPKTNTFLITRGPKHKSGLNLHLLT